MLEASRTSQLTADEIKHLRFRIQGWRVNYETSALLVERLLDRNTVATALLRALRSRLANTLTPDERGVIDHLLGDV